MNGHSVYVARDRNDEAVYVGRTSVGERRLRQHGKGSEWWPLTRTVRVYHFDTAEEAAVFEFEQIRFWRTEFNIDIPSQLRRPNDWDDETCEKFHRRHPLVRLVS